ncbi:hypothetical protein FEFB_15040 [Fructobacillus sp. EFB-N1]|uniref:hypothetical protein n=1 Tax=Fructobacillus sp. EFB-N1 TaxID=1658766 RepID=UPI00065D6522|nr:hypothetical protein [Fructobacillus sp. EFB-N1]KMK52756.1 hypothetical protein FEFB_15040 [Fructobacillus sp. EFB-N1]
MSKKITDENGNTYVQKKPFYKKAWFWIVVVLVVVIGGAGAGGSSSKNDSGSSSSKTSKKSTQKWTQADFDSLQKGDMMNKAQGGESLSSIESKYGKPSSTSNSSVNGMDTQIAIWSNTNGSLGSNVTLSFMKQDDGSWLLYSAASTGLK